VVARDDHANRPHSREEVAMTTSTFTVSGMSCEHCVAAVRTELGKVEGVTGVEVDLGSGRVTVTSDRPLDRAAVAAAVDEAGYELVDA
jgi:copper chaperone